MAPKTNPAASAKGKPRRKRFTKSMEEKLIDWFESHPLMYNTNSKNYRDTNKKLVLKEKIADRLGVEGNFFHYRPYRSQTYILNLYMYINVQSQFISNVIQLLTYILYVAYYVSIVCFCTYVKKKIIYCNNKLR